MSPKTIPAKITSNSSVFAVLVFTVSLSVLSVQAYAQVAGGTLTGTVVDTSRAVIANAQVSVRNVATGITRNIATDTAGLYLIPNLLPGNYEVKVSASG